MRRASLTSLRKLPYSLTPGTPNVWAYAPTEIASLSYETSKGLVPG